MIKLKTEADAIITDCKQSETGLNESIAKISSDVDKMRDRIIKQFEEAKQKLIADAKQFKSEEIKRIEQRSNASFKVKQDINTDLAICCSVLEHGTPSQQYIYSKMIKEKHNTWQSNINEHRNLKISSTVTACFPRELSTLLEMGNDFIKLDCNGNKPACLASQSRPFILELLVSVDLPTLQDDEKLPFLGGLDFLPVGRLVAVDNRNYKLIILNEQLQKLGKSNKFKTAPRDVLYLSPNELAITRKGKIVSFLSVSCDNVTRLTREINTTSEIFTVDSKSPYNMIVSTSDDPRPVRMISVDGVESDFDHIKFPQTTYKIDKSACTYVQSKNTLVLTDTFANTVYMYDTVKGTSRAVTDEYIQEPHGTCLGPGDTVLVCSRNNNSIVHLTVDGKILGTYPVYMIGPFSICVSKDGTRLAVSNIGEGAMKIQLYKISPAHS